MMKLSQFLLEPSDPQALETPWPLRLYQHLKPDIYIPSWELTYIPLKVTFEDDCPFPKVGYVSFVEGTVDGSEIRHSLTS